jgi:hypothetical protein
MQKKQHNKCGVCKKDITNNYTIDHCHKSNKIRGLLCRQCNTVLGLVHDNTDTLQNAIKYLNVSA